MLIEASRQYQLAHKRQQREGRVLDGASGWGNDP